jgi:hypothetical protein
MKTKLSNVLIAILILRSQPVNKNSTPKKALRMSQRDALIADVSSRMPRTRDAVLR